MRFADPSTRWLWVALCCAGAAGCASAPEPHAVPAINEAVAARKAASLPAPAPAAASAPAAVASQAPAEPEVVVSAAAQKTFDDARRAMRAGRMDEAERGFRAVLQGSPELGGPHANLGLIYRQAGKLPEAVAELEQAVRASPRQPIYYNQLGISYRMQGQFAKAKGAYERALELDAGDAAATLNLGILYDLYLWDGKRALELYDRYLSLSPDGDATVTKWVADLKNRKTAPNPASRKEKE